MFKLPIDQLSNYRLKALKNSGFEPRTILDIGAHHGSWSEEILGIFPDSKVIMFEGNSDCIPHLEETGHPYELVMLSNEEKKVPFYKHKGRYTTGDSLYKEQTSAYTENNCNIDYVECKTLDRVVTEMGLIEVDMIKIDVQGSEKDVLSGGKNIVKSAKVVLLELQILEYNKGAPMMLDILNFMDEIGFQMVDITELHYMPDHTLIQIDALFFNKGSDLMKNGMLC